MMESQAGGQLLLLVYVNGLPRISITFSRMLTKDGVKLHHHLAFLRYLQHSTMGKGKEKAVEPTKDVAALVSLISGGIAGGVEGESAFRSA